jgi:hypothetical protein
VLCAVCCVLCAVCRVLCAVCCVLCAVCCVLCAVCCVLLHGVLVVSGCAFHLPKASASPRHPSSAALGSTPESPDLGVGAGGDGLPGRLGRDARGVAGDERFLERARRVRTARRCVHGIGCDRFRGLGMVGLCVWGGRGGDCARRTRPAAPCVGPGCRVRV